MSLDPAPYQPRRGRWRRRLALAGLILAGLAGTGVTVRATLWPDGAAAPPPSAAVTVQDVEETVLANGVLEASRLVSVGAQVSGQIRSLHVELGDQVAAGDPIAEIDPLTRRNALRDAEAALAHVVAQKKVREAALKQAELAFARQARMLEGNATSREEYEAAEATLATTGAEIEALDAQIAQAEIAVDTARINLAYTEITAPMAGTVVAVPVKEGQTVNANQTTPTIVMLADLDTMTVSAEVSEADVIRVEPGQTVYFTILGDPDSRYYSILRSVEPAPPSVADSASGSSGATSGSSDSAVYYDALFDIENPEHRLRIAMTAQVSIVLEQALGALTIPAAALGIPDPERDGAYTVQVLTGDGRIEPRAVRVGINNSVRAEILEGLAEGERVVLDAQPEAAPESGRRRGFLGF